MPFLRAVLRLLMDRNAILILALVLGLLLGPALGWTTILTLPALAVIVFASSSQIPTEELLPPQRLIRPTLFALTFSYLVHSTVVLLLSRLLVPEAALLPGLVLVAAAPPAAAVLPFTAILGGDSTLSLLGVVGAYISALLIAPLLVQVLLGPGILGLGQLLLLLVEVILLPLLASRLLRRPRWLPVADRWWGPVINWSLFVVVLSIVAANRGVFLYQPGLLARLLLVAGLSIFGLSFLVEWVLSRLGAEPRAQVSLTLFAAIKNAGFAAATAQAVIGSDAAIPGTVFSVVIVFYLIYLGLRAERPRR